MVRIVVAILMSLSLSLANWYVKVEEGFEAAKRENKLVAFYFYSNHCPYCAHMEEFTLNQEEVQNKLKNFVMISLNISSDEGSRWARKLGVPGTPTIVFYDPKEGKTLGALFGSRSGGEVINFINGVCKRANKVC
ncbi:MAG: thioredoxin family protein [Aquificaceae bacterium]